VSNPPRPCDCLVFSGPRNPPFAPADRRWPGRRAALAECRPGRRVGGASGPWGRLEPVQEVLTGILLDGGPGLTGLTLVLTGYVP